MNKLHKHQICSVILLHSKLHICAQDFVNVHKIQVVCEEESYHKSRNHRWFSWHIVSNNARLHTYIQSVWNTHSIQHTHIDTRLTALFPGLPRWAGTGKVKPIWILLEQATVSGSGISWAICKSAPRSWQITMPTPHHSVLLHAGCPSCRPTNSVKALKALYLNRSKIALTIPATVCCHYFKFL